ncbi:hypothetical protein D3C83_215560 [compost metagenome]
MVMVRVGVERGELLQPRAEVVVQTAFIVVDEHRCRDVHRVDQHEPLLDAALAHRGVNLGCNVAKRHL